MKHSQTACVPGRQALTEAADWFVEFRAGDADAAAREDFNRWVRRSPEHIQAYLQIATTWAELSATNADAAVDVQQLVTKARSQRNVVPLDRAVAEMPRGAKRRIHPRLLALAATIACLGVGIALTLRGHAPSYTTGIGEQRFVTLSDGSTVELNARSSVRVHFGKQRVVELVAGQALFDIARDAGRPFVVKSGATTIRAIGTQFDVYRKESGTTVTVLEGRVAVSAGTPSAADVPAPVDGAPSAERPPVHSASLPPEHPRTKTSRGLVYLSAGERLVVTPSAALAPVATDVEAARAWTQRRLIFDSTRLADVVEEFNRYNHRPLLIDSESLDRMLISGVYSSTDPASLLRFLRHQPGVEVTEMEEGIRIHAR